MKIKIISEGTGRTSKVVSAETGEVIENVRGVTWTCKANGVAEATIEFFCVPVELNVDVNVDMKKRLYNEDVNLKKFIIDTVLENVESFERIGRK
jgi:hypothetical protein